MTASGPFFDVYGPYDVIYENRKCTGKQKEFWDGIALSYPNLHSAIGCYMFCLEFRGIIKPWYVGQTKAIKGFRSEVFQRHKIEIYNDCLSEYPGLPKMFFFPLAIREPHYKFSHNRTGNKRAIDWLEITLMGFAHRRNPRISNVKDMYFLRNVEVLGLLGRRPGRPFQEATAIRRTLFGKT